jgi:hypothetical protein
MGVKCTEATGKKAAIAYENPIGDMSNPDFVPLAHLFPIQDYHLKRTVFFKFFYLRRL